MANINTSSFLQLNSKDIDKKCYQQGKDKTNFEEALRLELCNLNYKVNV